MTVWGLFHNVVPFLESFSNGNVRLHERRDHGGETLAAICWVRRVKFIRPAWRDWRTRYYSANRIFSSTHRGSQCRFFHWVSLIIMERNRSDLPLNFCDHYQEDLGNEVSRFNWSILRWIDWLIDWLIGRRIFHWSSEHSVDWLIGWFRPFINWMSSWLISYS